MRKIILVFLLLAFLPLAASAKSVVYVSSQVAATERCYDLTGEDSIFCKELENLGYSVIVKNENAVVTNAWNSIANTADLIFLGDVSEPMTNISAESLGGKFCKFVFYANDAKSVRRGKPIFSAFGNSFVNVTSYSYGCGAQEMFPPETKTVCGGGTCSQALVYPINNNLCEKHIFKKQKDGYITSGIPSVVSIYTGDATAKITNKSQTFPTTLQADVWLADECQPSGGSQLDYFIYPTILTTNKGVFWGPDTPSKFTNTTWKIFDRAILFVLNDSSLNASFFTIPETPSSGEKFFIIADVKDRTRTSENATSYIWVGDAKIALNYDNVSAKWIGRDASSSKTLTSQFYAISGDGLKEMNISKEISAGVIKVNILSPLVNQNKTLIRAEISNSGAAVQVVYKIWNLNYSLVSSGGLSLKEGIYQANASVGETNYILEIDARDSSGKVGGAYREVSESRKLEPNQDFILTPNEIYSSHSAGKTITQKFILKAVSSDIKNLRILKSGPIANDISVDMSNASFSINAGNETFFSVSINANNYQTGTYRGKFVVDAENLNYEIPIEIIIDPLVKGSDWLGANPKSWRASIPKGNLQTKTFNLVSLGIYHAGDIKFEATGDFKNLLKVPDISFIKAHSEVPVELTLDTTKLSEGSHKGDIQISSSIGNEIISVDINIVGDFSNQIEELKTNISSLESKIAAFNSTGADLVKANAALEEARQAIELVENKWKNQDYEGAKASIPAAQAKLAALEKEVSEIREPFPIIYVVVLIILIIIVFIVLKFRNKIGEIFKKKKKPEIPPEEGGESESDTYKPPPSGDSGYRPEYY